MKIRLLGIAAAAAVCLAWNCAAAQHPEEVIVEASPIVKSPTSGPNTLAPGYFTVAMSSRVAYKDLDLRKPADVATLKQRVKDAATEVCDALGRAYPETGPETAQCAEQAVKRAMPSVQKAIAAAK